MDSRRKQCVRFLAWLSFIVYIFFIVYFMFMSEELGRSIKGETYRYNLKVGNEIKRFWYNRDTLGIKVVIVNIVGNVITFMPFGFILPMLTRKKVYKNIITVTMITALFSLMIETIQLNYRIGAFDVDDIILNTMGGFLGCFIYHICNTIRVLMKKSSKK